VKANFLGTLGAAERSVPITMDGEKTAVQDGSVVIAAITQLHQHLESIGDGGGRPAGEEGRREKVCARNPG